MKSLRKSILTLLALTLFGGAGAWAQGPTNVTQFTTDMLPASWATDNSDVTLADLQALGFEAVDESVAQAWTGAPQGEYAVLIYGFNGTYFNYIIFYASGDASDPSYTGYSKRGFYENVAYGDIKHFYTGTPAIELTKVGDNQWSLAETPDYDPELQVEYYDQYTLDSIPLGWQVKVGNAEPVYPTAYTEGNTSLGYLAITETDSVELIPPAEVKPNVKSVTLVEPVTVQTITVSGHKIYYLPGETWEQAIMNHPENTGWYIQGSWVFFDGLGGLLYDESPYNEVGKGDNIDPNRPYYMGI